VIVVNFMASSFRSSRSLLWPRRGADIIGRACSVDQAEGRRLRKRIAAPGGCRELERELAPWLRW